MGVAIDRAAAARLWRQFRASLAPAARAAVPDHYSDVCPFGTTPTGADECAALVLEGTKSSTGSLLWAYEFDGKPLPQVGDHWVVVDGRGRPACIVETTEVRTLAFEDVDAGFAWDGGEQDRSLESWRRMYAAYIRSECRRIGRDPGPQTPLVCERFRVVHRAEPVDR